MSRIRTIKPEFWTSAQIIECSLNARLLFIGLWNFCDDSGRHSFSPKRIKAEVFPADDMSIEAIQGMLTELSVNGLIRVYSIGNKEILEVTGWRHQKINRPQPSKFSDKITESSVNYHGPFSGGREGKGRYREDSLPLKEKKIKTKKRKAARSSPSSLIARSSRAVHLPEPVSLTESERIERAGALRGLAAEIANKMQGSSGK